MSKTIAAFGVGPGLGQAVARCYAREGYTVVLVARRQEPLDLLATDLTRAGATAHAITADLSDTAATPRLAERAAAEGRWAILTFHGIGEGHLPVAEVDLRELCSFLARRRDRLWTAPVVTIATRIQQWR